MGICSISVKNKQKIKNIKKVIDNHFCQWYLMEHKQRRYGKTSVVPFLYSVIVKKNDAMGRQGESTRGIVIFLQKSK